MRKWIEKLEAMSMAVAFAEAGEWSTATNILDKTAEKRPEKRQETRKPPRQRPRMYV